MVTLSWAAERTKIILKWLGILAAAGVVLFVIIWAGTYVKNLFFPPPPPQAEAAFGTLPPIQFEDTATDKTLTYSIDTLSGQLPSLPSLVKVFKTVNATSQFRNLEIAQSKVSSIGFTSTGIPLSQNVYEWADENTLSRTMIMDIVSGNFSLTSSYLLQDNNPADFGILELPDAKSIAQSFFQRVNSFPSDIDSTKTKTESYFIQYNNLIPATTIGSTHVMRVDFFRQDIDSLPIYHSRPNQSPIYAIVWNKKNEERIVEANYVYKTINKEQQTTYPIKTAQEAFEELKNKKARVASYSGNETDIAIKNVFLGYYMGAEEQEYIMPIIILQGDNNFYAYVSAVRDEWISN